MYSGESFTTLIYDLFQYNWNLIFLQKRAKNSCFYAEKSMKISETVKKKWSSFMKLDQFQKKSENNF